MEDVLKNVLKKVKPDEATVAKIAVKVEKFTKRLSAVIDAEITLGGSYAKDTYLSDIKDVDIYVQFDRKYADHDISLIVKEALDKMKVKFEVLHGSRDYFQIHDGLLFEVVPIIKINKASEAFNITDISPLHVKWVKRNCRDTDQIRLTKAFAKAQGFYGAESYIMGFSGYALEILTTHYGSFKELLEKASRWKSTEIIDINKFHKDVLFEVNSSKLNSPLILIDPVEAGRNTTASLSVEKYELFRLSAMEFLAAPDEKFFQKKPITLKSLKNVAGKNQLVVVDFHNHPGKEDVEGCKILKVHNYITRKLEQNGFKLIDSGWTWNKVDKAMCWYIVDHKPIDKTYIRRGPPTDQKENVNSFKEKYKDTYEESDRLFAKVKREFTRPKDFVDHLLGRDYTKDRIKSSKVVHH